MKNQLSLDETAAQMAEGLYKGGNGDLPQGRGGDSGAEGGFTTQAGGKVIDADAEKAGYTDAELERMNKAGKTGAAATSEPGRQGQQGKTGADATSEPQGDSGDGSTMGMEQTDSFRSRKDSTSDARSMMPADEDEKMRKRKAGKAGMSKADPEMDDEEEDDDEDMEEEEKGCKKSDSEIDADALIKSLETLEAIAQGSTVRAPAERREELAERLSAGTLSKSEMQELSELMKAGYDDEIVDPLEKSDDVDDWDDDSYQSQFAEDEDLNKSFGDDQDISDFLECYSQRTAAALDQVQTTLAKSLELHRDKAVAFNTQLAKSLRGMAQLAQSQEALIKSMSERLEVVENTPLPRKGVSNARALHKSLSDEVGADEGVLQKSDVMDSLENMAMRGIVSTASGHRVDHAIALIEQNGQLAKSLYNDVVAWRQQNSGQVRVG